MKRSCVGFVTLFLLGISAVYAQDEVSQKATIQAGFGTVTMGDVQWQRFSFRPDIPLGKFGVGLDIEVFIDEKGKISKEGWDFSNRNKTWDTLLRKIYYLRYGKPLDKLYARAGALDDVTLGYGLIMDGYRNTLNYPADKKLGLDFSVRDVGTFGIGVQAMVNSFGDLKNEGAVVGGRVSVRPLKSLDKGLISKLTVGATFVRDINQYAGLKDSDNDGVPDIQDGFPNDKKRWVDTDRDGIEDYIITDGVKEYVDPDADGDNLTDAWWSDTAGNKGFDNNVVYDDPLNIKNDKNGVSVWGADVGLPLIEGKLNLDLYGQYANIHTGDSGNEGGWGIGAPGLRLIVQRFKGQIEYRHFDGRFRPNYFDNLYEHERVTLVGTMPRTKEDNLPDDILNGVYGAAGYNFFDMISARASYQYMTGDKTYQDVSGKIVVLDQILKQIPKISIAEAYYYNTYVTDPYDIWDNTDRTLYGTRIGFEIAPSLMIVWDTHYTFTPNANGGFDRNRFVGIETVMKMR